MSTESLRKTDTKTINNPQFEPTESKSKKTFLQISDLELNKIQEVQEVKDGYIKHVIYYRDWQ